MKHLVANLEERLERTKARAQESAGKGHYEEAARASIMAAAYRDALAIAKKHLRKCGWQRNETKGE